MKSTKLGDFDLSLMSREDEVTPRTETSESINWREKSPARDQIELNSANTESDLGYDVQGNVAVDQNATSVEEPAERHITEREIRRLNREITRRTIVHDIDKIADERNVLLAKRISQTITEEEDRRLEYLGWQLDRIEDAIIGDKLDGLEAMVRSNQELANQIQSWVKTADKIAEKLTLKR